MVVKVVHHKGCVEKGKQNFTLLEQKWAKKNLRVCSLTKRM